MFRLMKPTVCIIGLFALCGSCQNKEGSQAQKAMLVEASCGQCQFDQPGTGCDLAIRIDERVYYVDGTGIDDHGDAHGTEGLCNAIRLADVEGTIENERFVASSFVLRPATEGQ